MNMFDRDAVERLNSLAELARNQLREVIKVADVPACVTGAGSMFRVHMKPNPPQNYRESFASPQQNRLIKTMLDYLSDNGFIMINTCSGTLSTVMTEHEISRLSETMLGGFRELKKNWDQS
jgi:glutamate-1-semialdehyde 2,1-aminomutase